MENRCVDTRETLPSKGVVLNNMISKFNKISKKNYYGIIIDNLILNLFLKAIKQTYVLEGSIFCWYPSSHKFIGLNDPYDLQF